MFNDPLTLMMLAILGVLVVMMFRNSRKRKADALEMQNKLQPGVRVMTNFGLFGTLVSINEEDNVAVIATLSGAELELHRQTIARVVEPTVAEDVAAAETGDAKDAQ